MFLLERKGNSDTDSGPSEEFTVLGVTNNGEPHNAECMQHCASAFPCEGWHVLAPMIWRCIAHVITYVVAWMLRHN